MVVQQKKSTEKILIKRKKQAVTMETGKKSGKKIAVSNLILVN